MKHAARFLFTLLCFVTSLESLSQENQTQSQMQFEAGAELKKFARQYYTGLGITVGGVLISNAGSVSQDPNLFIAGSVMVLGGFVYQVLSFIKIGRAGQYLMIGSQQLGLNQSRSLDVGLRFRLGNKDKYQNSMASSY